MTSFHDITAIVLAGGLGTRLRGAAPDVQKVVAPVAAKPFLFRVLDHIERHPFAEIILCAGYRADTLESALANRPATVPIRLVVEDHALGTGGAVRQAFSTVKTDTALVFNGDSFCDVDLEAMLERFHASSSPLLMAACEVPDVARYGMVETTPDSTVRSFREKGAVSGKGWINAGIYCLDRLRVERFFPDAEVFSLEREVFPRMAEQGAIDAFLHRGRFIDIGTPESYRDAEGFFA